ncbi:hypothetical protein K0P19_28890 [Shinella sp. YE25]|nr:hypothetical protein [Shinella sp. YE25]
MCCIRYLVDRLDYCSTCPLPQASKSPPDEAASSASCSW